MTQLLRKLYRRALNPIVTRLDRLQAATERNRMLLVQDQIRRFRETPPLKRISDAEFSVFSEWGEDGIIQYLLSKIPVPNPIFVEFGVENYQEANTRFLLMNNNWKGMVIEADPQALADIQAGSYYWRHDLTAVCSFITKDNINRLIERAGITGDIGVLSIDIDGNDYWIWREISVISPRIVIIEYNSIFGNQRAVTIPYDEHFQRTRAHHSNLYYGASLPALYGLAQEKGYVFAGTNRAGSNAFFVRNDTADDIIEHDVSSGYVESCIRESRNEQGVLTFASGKERLRLIQEKTVLDLQSGRLVPLKDLLPS